MFHLHFVPESILMIVKELCVTNLPKMEPFNETETHLENLEKLEIKN